MKKFVVMMVVVACFGMMGCRMGALTEEEKQKIQSMQKEIADLEGQVKTGNVELAKYESGLVPSLIKARIEIDTLTISILRQHIAAIESGSKMTTQVNVTTPDSELLTSLESEYKSAEQELMKSQAKSALYAGGLIKALAESEVATHAMTLAALKQKMLAAKYGLWISAPASYEKSLPPAVADTPPKETIQQAAPPKVEDPGPFDFRKTRWGMSMEDVIAREGQPHQKNGDEGLAYAGNLLGHKVQTAFIFSDDKLVRAGYVLAEEQYSNKNSYVDAYDSIVSSLKEKYGKPASENTYWSRDLYKNDYSRRGMAYSLGDVQTTTEWNQGSTEIAAQIYGNNYKISVRIIYSSKELFKDYERQRQEREKSNL